MRNAGSSAQLYNYRERWYDPNMGRFLGEDPAQDGTNWYNYPRDPINTTDPSGLKPEFNPLNNLFSGPINPSFANQFSVSLDLIDTSAFSTPALTPSQTSLLNTSFVTPFGSQPAVSSNSFQLRHVDDFPANSRSTFTDTGGRTRTIIDAGAQTLVFDPHNGFETGERLNTIRGAGGGSFQVFATPSMAKRLVIPENRSTAQLAGDAALTLTGANLIRLARTAGVSTAAVQGAREIAEEVVQTAVFDATGVPIPVRFGGLRGPVTTTSFDKGFIPRNSLQGAAGEFDLVNSVARNQNELVLLRNSNIAENGSDVATFNTRSGFVTLFDNKSTVGGRPNALGIRSPNLTMPSQTFVRPRTRLNAVGQVEQALPSSGLSRAQQNQVLDAIQRGNVRFVTRGSGNTPNSVIQFLQDFEP